MTVFQASLQAVVLLWTIQGFALVWMSITGTGSSHGPAKPAILPVGPWALGPTRRTPSPAPGVAADAGELPQIPVVTLLAVR
jgi:hypothetical protein